MCECYISLNYLYISANYEEVKSKDAGLNTKTSFLLPILIRNFKKARAITYAHKNNRFIPIMLVNL